MPELVGLARTMRSLATPVETSREDLVDTAGTGGGPSTFNVSTTAALVAAGAGCAVAKHGNRSNTSKCGSADLLEALGVNIELEPEQVGRCIDEVGFGFMFAPAPPRGDGPRRAGPQGARRAHDLQLPRAADQPGGGRAAAARRLRPPLPGDDRRGAGRARQRAGDGRRRRGRGRRALDLRPHAGDRGRRRAAPRSGSSSRASSASRPASWRRSPAAARRRTPPPRAPCSTAATARAATSSLLNAGAAIYVGGRAGDLAEGVEKAAEAIDCGAARELLDRLVATTAQLARLGFVSHVGMIEQLIAAAREGVEERRSGTSPGGTGVAALPARGDDRPVQRGAGPARPVADRRVQAALAERRRDLGGGDRRRAGRRLRARRRGGALGAHRRAPLRRLARGPARRPRRLRPADPAQGLHRRPLPALRGGGQRRRRGAADRPGARRRARCASCTRRRADSTSTAWSRSTTRRSWSGRWSSTPT